MSKIISILRGIKKEEGNLVVIKDGDYKNAVVLDEDFDFKIVIPATLKLKDSRNSISIPVDLNGFYETDSGFNLSNYTLEVM